jgi:CRISPR type II-A-associated protein Csn2
MKIVLSDVDYVFDCGKDKCCSIVIENQRLFYKVIADITAQTEGNDGDTVLSEDNKILAINKYGEIITQFIPFDMNTKTLVSKISSRIQKLAVADVNYMRTEELLAEWEKYLMELSIGMVGGIEFNKITTESLIKASGVHIDDLYDSLGEKLIDYFELVQEYDAKKLFVLVNLRSYISDAEMEEFLRSVLDRNIQILLLEGTERPLLENEERYIIDDNFCIIC